MQGDLSVTTGNRTAELQSNAPEVLLRRVSLAADFLCIQRGPTVCQKGEVTGDVFVAGSFGWRSQRRWRANGGMKLVTKWTSLL